MQPLLIDAPEMNLLPMDADSAVASRSSGHSQFEAEDSTCTFEALNSRAKAITPLLHEIFHARPPIRWGINE